MTLPSLMVIDLVKLEMHLFENITWSHDRWDRWLDGCGQLNLSHTLLIGDHCSHIGDHCLSEGGDKVFFNITWSNDQWVTRLSGSDTLNLNHKVYSKSSRTQKQKYICITNWGMLVLQIRSALFYYKLGQTLVQIGGASLLQIGAGVATNWGSYYKLGQPLLQNRAAITNWGKIYYKLGQVLQIRAIVTNWGITFLPNYIYW